MRAEDVGAPWEPLVLGKHSGRHAVQQRCKELKLKVSPEDIIDVYRTLMSIADDQKTITDEDVLSAVKKVRKELRNSSHVESLKVTSRVTGA